MSRSADVDAYIAALEPERAARLSAIREAAQAAFPDVVERVEWRMPVFQRGERWFAAASQKSYVSVYLRNVALVSRIVAADPRLKQGKGCLNIRDTVPVPIDAIREGLAEVLG